MYIYFTTFFNNKVLHLIHIIYSSPLKIVLNQQSRNLFPLRVNQTIFVRKTQFYLDVEIKTRNAVSLHAIKAYSEAEVQLNSFFISALDGVEWSVPNPDRSPGK
jgi:hypothetical protein